MKKTGSITLHPKSPRAGGTGVGLLALHSGRQLVPHLRPDPETANGYLRMTAHILLRAKERSVRAIGVLSGHEGEGNTTAAINLAICLGRTRGLQGRVLLVDGDARRRAVTKLFCGEEGAPSEPNQSQMVRTQFEGVDLRTAPASEDGLTLHDPTAWLESFAELRGHYAHIIVACPPLLEAPESMILCDCVDEIVLVVRAGEASLSEVTETVNNLKRRVIGVVLSGGHSHPREANKVTA